jgi:hypothetical protein
MKVPTTAEYVGAAAEAAMLRSPTRATVAVPTASARIVELRVIVFLLFVDA